MAGHARLSPSSAHRWMRCTGSVALCDKLPAQPSSAAADEGTFCHELAALWLREDVEPRAGDLYVMANGSQYIVTQEQVDMVTYYVDAVRAERDLKGGGLMMVEQSLLIQDITGEDDARGTADAILLLGDELQVHDLKMGRGVPVAAEDNEQLMTYALAALEQFSPATEIRRVRGFIHQPRINGPDPLVATWTPEELRQFGQRASTAAVNIMVGKTTLVPGEKQCRFCPAKATCPALTAVAHEAAAAAFDDLTPEDKLADSLAKLDLIEQWCKDVRAEAERRLLRGDKVRGFKLVEGRKGNRVWTDEAEAEKMLKVVLGERAYRKEVISVAVAEKALKSSHPETWSKYGAVLIKQSPGRPSVAPESDKRPAIQPGSVTADVFETIE